MLAVTPRRGKDVDPRFAELPWDEHTPRWQEIDHCLPADHLACQIAQAVEELDLAGLFATYSGRGSKALWPDLLLKLVLYDLQRGRLSPAEWFLDAKENEPVQWLLFGMKPSRTACYGSRIAWKDSGTTGTSKRCTRRKNWGCLGEIARLWTAR